MDRHNKTSNGLERLPLVSMIFGAVFMAAIILVLTFSGHPLGIGLIGGILGVTVSYGVVYLIGRATTRSKSYWTLMISIYAVVILGLAILSISYSYGSAISGASMGFVVSFASFSWDNSRRLFGGSRGSR